MKKLIKNGFVAFAAIVVVATAAHAASVYNAVCADSHGSKGWISRDYDTYAEADAAAKAHKRATGHEAIVLSF